MNQGKTLLLQRMMLENMCFCLKKPEWDNEMPVGSATIPPPVSFFALQLLVSPVSNSPVSFLIVQPPGFVFGMSLILEQEGM